MINILKIILTTTDYSGDDYTNVNSLLILIINLIISFFFMTIINNMVILKTQIALIRDSAFPFHSFL